MIVGYTTDKVKGKWIVEELTNRLGGDIIHANTYLREGSVPEGTKQVILHGILRGTGLIYRECLLKGIDMYYIDHAYFMPSRHYDERAGWMRITKNAFVQNQMISRPSSRWRKWFADDPRYRVLPWRGYAQGGQHILVLPPTPAVKWCFKAYNWAENVVAQIRNVTNLPIIWREKPGQIKVDKLGFPEGKIENPSVPAGTIQSQRPLEYDLENAHAVISFNSNVAIDATLKGIPVICGEHCPAYPISFSIRDIGTNKLNIEPNRKKWLYNLAYSQFSMGEIRSADCWRILND